LEKQNKIIEIKEENYDKEEEKKLGQSIKQRNIKYKHKIFDFDNDSDINNEKKLKRSRSSKVKKKKKLTRIDNNLLVKLMGRNSIIRSNSAKKQILENDWYKYLLKSPINKHSNQKEKKNKFIKRKKKTNRILKKKFFIDENKSTKDELEEKDEEIENLKNEIRKNKLRKKQVEKQLYEFFNRIQTLKKGSSDNTQKEIEILIDEQLDKMDYKKAKENESRVNNFIQDFDLNRTKNKQYYSRKMHYLSPIIFFTKQNEEKNSL